MAPASHSRTHGGLPSGGRPGVLPAGRPTSEEGAWRRCALFDVSETLLDLAALDLEDELADRLLA